MTDIFLNTLQNIFKLEDFRGPQRLVCETIHSGQDVLLVMPTGAGKSLCYQLPGLLSGGTTLVVSPLIALMDDQYLKLTSLGIVAERIHSGMNPNDVDKVVRRYIEGELDFLLIAPERLGDEFLTCLQQRPPTLIAADEIHLVSSWGVEFRPAYRLLRDRLPPGVPIIALTATATPRVQLDILDQLGRPNAQLIVHGFRRTNLGLSIVSATSKQRENCVMNYLKDSSTKPAIVYSSTRKQTESVAATLQKLGHRVGAYHAGMTPKVRADVQSRFMAGDLDVIVATIAFGMGIDKSNIRTVLHLSMPGSIEAYYQEVGRAGRDGLLSKAVLFTNYEDKAKQLWFFDKNYPKLSQLDTVYRQLTEEPQSVPMLHRKCSHLEESDLTQILGKLMSLRAATKSYECYTKGDPDYRIAYTEILKYHMAKIEAMYNFTQDTECRMLGFLHYFGDTNDDYAPCGLCDICLKRAKITPAAANKAASEKVAKADVGKGFRVSQHVTHSKFGIGRVEKIESKGISGQVAVTVMFPDGSHRVIMEKFLEKTDETF